MVKPYTGERSRGNILWFSTVRPFPIDTRRTANNRIRPSDVIDRGVGIMCNPENRNNRRIHSELHEILEEAATGSRLGDLTAFSAFFNKLL